MALKCIKGRMTIIELVSALDLVVTVDLSLSAKYGSIRRLKEAGFLKEVKDPATRGKTLEITPNGKNELEEIEKYWSSL